MDERDNKFGSRLGPISVALLATGLLASCAGPDKQPLSPVADPNAPMRVSTARVTTEAPDPVGRLFNDGPRMVVTYSVNADPLAVLFRDPAFIVKLSPTAPDDPSRSDSQPAEPPSTTMAMRAADTSEPQTTLARVASEQKPEPIQRRMVEPATQKPTGEPVSRTALASTSTPEPAPEVREKVEVTTITTAQAPEAKSAPSTETTPTASTSTGAESASPVAVAAATTAAPARPESTPAPDTVTTNEPIVLDGLKQKAAGWPIATRPANTFGAKGPDGTAWRGLVYKSPAQTPVKAIEPGKVVFAQPLRSYGNVIIIDHGKDYTSIYGYNETLTKKVGDTVRKGETVALVGDSGPLADEALYFEIRKDSVPINPSLYLTSNP